MALDLVAYFTFLTWFLAVCFRMDLACNIALEATSLVTVEQDGRREIDIKRYAKVEKVSLISMIWQHLEMQIFCRNLGVLHLL